MVAKRLVEIVRESGFEDEERWIRKWKSLKGNQYFRQCECKLTLREYLQLAREAGLTNPDQIGRHEGQYHMSRLGDVGNYEIGNCRFLVHADNRQEKLDNNFAGRMRDRFNKSFRVVSPSGEVYEGKGLKEFCKSHGLYYNAMSNLLKNGKPYKGWSGEYI